MMVATLAICRRKKLDLYLVFCRKFNSKVIQGLHIRPGTLNLSEDKNGKRKKKEEQEEEEEEGLCLWT